MALPDHLLAGAERWRAVVQASKDAAERLRVERDGPGAGPGPAAPDASTMPEKAAP